MDNHQHVVTTLKRESLILTEDKLPVTEAELVRGLDMPLELGILIDTSGSERESTSLPQIVSEAKAFASDFANGESDRVFFMTFAKKTQATGWLKREQIGSVSLDLKLNGGTSLYDSLAIACRERLHSRDDSHATRRILVIISDGDDSQSEMTRDQAVSEAILSGAVIFAMDTRSFLGKGGKGDRILEYMAEITGGQFFSGFTRGEVRQVFQRMKLIGDGMYYVRFVPPPSNKRVHEVEVRPAAGEKLQLSYPKKYLWVQ